MKRLLAEPLLHFLLLGLLVFLAYRWMGEDAGSPDEIVVTRGQLANLAGTFQRTWRRPPSPEEMQGLIREYVRLELAYRESEARELDRNDIVIKRRLQQKLELLAEDLAGLDPPTTAELQAYLDASPDRFRAPAMYSFEHIYFSPERRGAQAEHDAAQLLQALRGGGVSEDPATLGDFIDLPTRFGATPDMELDKVFGPGFAEQIASYPAGEWSGPAHSGYGLHLVRIDERTQSRVPALEEIEDKVRFELLSARRATAVDALYEALARKYTVRVEPATAPDGDAEGPGDTR